MMKAADAMRQAWITAHEYFRHLADEVDERYPTATANARLSAAVELSKVAAQDFHTAVIGGVVDESDQPHGALSEIAAAIRSMKGGED